MTAARASRSPSARPYGIDHGSQASQPDQGCEPEDVTVGAGSLPCARPRP
jgi:hypothetical protein